MKNTWIVLVLVFWQGLVFGIEQDYYQALMRSGNEAYQSNQWDSALANYEMVLDAGLKSTNLYYNVGNVHFKLGNVSEAILFYERALKLSPGDQDVLYNLNIANTRIIDAMESLPTPFYKDWFTSFRNTFTSKGWSYLGLVFFWLFCASVVLFLLTQQAFVKKLAFVVALPLVLIAATGMVMANQQQNSCTSEDSAIVFQASVNVQSEPSANSTRLFVVHEGLKVSISQQVNNWFEVVLPDGNKGWIHADELQII